MTAEATGAQPVNQRDIDTLVSYFAAKARGDHDGMCEMLARPWICHCSKRARIERGLTEITSDVVWKAPLCPECYEDLNNDGDGGYDCTACHASFSPDGTFSTFYDDYGDDSFEGIERHPASGRPLPDARFAPLLADARLAAYTADKAAAS